MSSRLPFRAAWLCLGLTILVTAPSFAASPSSGTVSAGHLETTWTGSGSGLPTASSTCGGPSNSKCDNFQLVLSAPSYSFSLEITATPQAVDDYDLEVYNSSGQLVGSSANGPGAVEKVTLSNPASGTYTVSTSKFLALLGYTGKARIVAHGSSGTGSANLGFAVYAAPAGMGDSSGEPSVGVNWSTDNVMYIAGLETLRVSFDDCFTPAQASWQDKSYLTTSLLTLDPILFTDPVTGRTLVSQLAGLCSSMAYSDNDGDSWLPSQGCGINSGVDHQSVGGGPFAPPLLGLLGYPHAVYYCSQDIAIAQCAVSLDGGRTFGVAVPIYNMTQCGGLHGHVKVGPDGTAYVPNKNCNGEQGVAVSEDNGLTWTVRHVPGTSAGPWDPSVGIASDGTVYIGMTYGGRPYVAVSQDKGQTWTSLQQVGTSFGIQNTAFPVVVAGDGDRAAVGFLGSSQGGDGSGTDASSNHVWYPYVSLTTDGGQTWTTVNVSPNDPVQRGNVCSLGTTCGAARNLLDFNDIAVDSDGHVVFAYADGCVGSCVSGPPNSGAAKATLARQTTGPRLFAAYDGTSSCP